MKTNRCISLDDSKIYAIVRTCNDVMWNNNETDLIIFFNEEEYLRFIESWQDEQVYTGRTWWTYYKEEKK